MREEQREALADELNHLYKGGGEIILDKTQYEKILKHMNTKKDHDPVNHPRHYTNHPSGIECIEITRHMGFNLGNAMKYIWRADMKGGIEDLQKAIWYIQDEISKRNTVVEITEEKKPHEF